MALKILLLTLLLSSFIYSGNADEDRLAQIKKEMNIGQPIVKEEKLSDKEAQKLRAIQLELGLIKPKPKPQENSNSVNIIDPAKEQKKEIATQNVNVVETKELTLEQKKFNLSEKDRLAKIRAELGIRELTPKEKRLAEIKRELNIGYEIPKKDNSFNNAIKELKKEIDIEKIKDSLSFDGDISDISIDSIKDTLHIEEGEYLGLPSIFGINKKEVPKTILGSTILANLKNTGDNMYKGFKYSGSSAETITGLMYYNSKAYNSMFSIFDGSAINIFEDKKEDKSIFDIFD